MRDYQDMQARIDTLESEVNSLQGLVSAYDKTAAEYREKLEVAQAEIVRLKGVMLNKYHADHMVIGYPLAMAVEKSFEMACQAIEREEGNQNE